ncbi:PREDICTED: uncharacterized protein LOC109226193 [Nicotiana attenuata]|uniref:uncharacterized protein LOC109226193 n=1 Tax=Nicotiana attenuata TaxID=49451 RepID=UPI000904AA1D|nr:PREDICTED: uncharacterized protein LOC109226193 [Nicotiana attenuata]
MPGLDNYKELYKGMSFKDIPEARKYLNFYALANKKELKLLKSSPKRLRYGCVFDCPFIVYITPDGDLPGVRVKTLKAKHTCDEAFENSRVDYYTIANYFKKKVQDDPKFKIKEMRVELKNTFNINVSYGKCKRAKRLILEKLDALEQGNRKFLRMYTCFQALKMGFREGLRPFIGLDGTFFKGKVKGQLLLAVDLDANNQAYPVAWAVVDKETKRTWTWFLDLLQRSLDLKDGEGITFMSDMQKGLIEAVQNVLPDSHHRFCVKHIEANWCKRWRTDEFKKLLWWSAWSSYEEDFKDQLKSIGELGKEAVESLLKYPPHAWCRAYFDTVCKNQKDENNFTESVNAWLVEARQKPIIKVLEEIRIKLMNQLREREEALRSWANDFSPHNLKFYNEYFKIANTSCYVDSNGDNGYEVREGTDKDIVNMVLKKCTCRGWDLTGIPCPHAIKSLQLKRLEPMNEIKWWYSKEAYLLTYKYKLQPVRGEKFWKVDPSQAMEPPELAKMAGRPKIKRTRQKDEAIKRQGEWAASRKGRVMTCNNYGESNHNARGCEKPPMAKRARQMLDI